jgi:hypothetical protein
MWLRVLFLLIFYCGLELIFRTCNHLFISYSIELESNRILEIQHNTTIFIMFSKAKWISQSNSFGIIHNNPLKLLLQTSYSGFMVVLE